jgi:broad specificity phosphatase PhoE
MSGARLIFVRHAETHNEMRGRVVGRTDVALSTDGVAHAERIGVRLATEPIAAVYSSPLRRALATAAPLARTLGLEVTTAADLREIDFGELEGLTVGEATERYPVEANWMTAPAGARFPGGESVASLRERAVGAAHHIAAGHQGETVAVFSHAVVIRAIVADALSMPPDAMFRLDQSYGGVTILEWFDAQPFVRMVNAA